jgi:hypothetical protein
VARADDANPHVGKALAYLRFGQPRSKTISYRTEDKKPLKHQLGVISLVELPCGVLGQQVEHCDGHQGASGAGCYIPEPVLRWVNDAVTSKETHLGKTYSAGRTRQDGQFAFLK